MEFSEKNSPKSVIEVGLDGEYLYSELQLAELTVPVASYGTWVNESVFKLVVIPRNMAQYHEFYFHFLPLDIVRVTSHVIPSIRDMLEFYLQFNGMIMTPLLRKAITPIAAGIGVVMDPSFTGVIK
ncbi:MAG: hypothetical protein IKN72_00580 [Clostridia bacterium]|nr:hypothetical protein [Clostridia bacterium]